MAWFRRDAHPKEQLSAYIDGELDTRARAAVETHLATCDACTALAEELRQAKSLLAALPRQAPRRSFTLGPAYAVERRPVPQRRSSFTFAPVAALTVLVALLFVDAADFSGMSSSEDAASTAGGATARQSESAKDDAGLSSDAFQGPAAAGAAAESAATQGPVTAAGAPNPNPTPSAPTLDRAAEDSPEDGASATLEIPPAGDSGDGISTLRILEIAAALALVASLAFVYLPRVLSRER